MGDERPMTAESTIENQALVEPLMTPDQIRQLSELLNEIRESLKHDRLDSVDVRLNFGKRLEVLLKNHPDLMNCQYRSWLICPVVYQSRHYTLIGNMGDPKEVALHYDLLLSMDLYMKAALDSQRRQLFGTTWNDFIRGCMENKSIDDLREMHLQILNILRPDRFLMSRFSQLNWINYTLKVTTPERKGTNTSPRYLPRI